VDLIEEILIRFEKSLENVICIIGDNCATNAKIARLVKVPLVGCSSHRFNLQVKKYYSEHEPLLTKLSQFMSKIGTLKIAGFLREHTELRPKTRCSTRWSGDFKMVKRYFELRQFLPATLENFPDLGAYCLSQKRTH